MTVEAVVRRARRRDRARDRRRRDKAAVASSLNALALRWQHERSRKSPRIAVGRRSLWQSRPGAAAAAVCWPTANSGSFCRARSVELRLRPRAAHWPGDDHRAIAGIELVRNSATGSNRSIGASSDLEAAARAGPRAVASLSGCGRVTRTAMSIRAPCGRLPTAECYAVTCDERRIAHGFKARAHIG